MIFQGAEFVGVERHYDQNLVGAVEGRFSGGLLAVFAEDEPDAAHLANWHAAVLHGRADVEPCDGLSEVGLRKNNLLAEHPRAGDADHNQDQRETA